MNVGIPPRSLNHRLAACRLRRTNSQRSVLAAQPIGNLTPNNRSHVSTKRWLPGDFIGALPVNSVIHSAGLPISMPWSLCTIAPAFGLRQ